MRSKGPDLDLSVVVIVASDTINRRARASLLEGTLHALTHQNEPPSFEIIVPFHSLTSQIPPLREKFPDVRFLEVPNLRSALQQLPGHEHHHELRAAGIEHASGRIVALTEDHGRPAEDWMRRIVDAHEAPHAAIGGAIENETDHPLNWAIYFCDFGRYQRPFSAGAATAISDSNASYKRSVLGAIRPAWARGFREPAVNAAIVARGSALYLSPDIVVYQRRGELSFADSMRERYIWGRSYGVQRVAMISAARRTAYALLSPLLPALLVTRMTARALERRRTLRQFARALPYTVALTTAWACGEAAGYLSGRLPGAD